MQRKFRVIPCLISGCTNGFNIIEVLILDHEYAISENEILILDNDSIEIGDVVTVDGTILKKFDENIVPSVEPIAAELAKKELINSWTSVVAEQTGIIELHQAFIAKRNEKITAINANTPNIKFGDEEIKNAPDNAARLVLLNAAIAFSQNKISEASAKIDEANSELTILQS
jgi:hypothetical protein